jgi:DNA-binding transcriptional MerR regulator|tara:strand:+ start:3027 stop:3545 length:519 start_codon:yes stop_codon:yes gene_type:complete
MRRNWRLRQTFEYLVDPDHFFLTMWLPHSFKIQHMSMMTIKLFAKSANVSRETVRHYVALGLIEASKHPENGYQLFSEKELMRMRFIRGAQQLGFKLQEVKMIFEDAQKGNSSCPRVRELLADHIKESKRRIQQLVTLNERMESALLAWGNMPDGTPNGDSICCLIESQNHE